MYNNPRAERRVLVAGHWQRADPEASAALDWLRADKDRREDLRYESLREFPRKQYSAIQRRD